MRAIQGRMASIAFPASAVVIITAAVIRYVSGHEIGESVAAAATGLLTWLAYVVLAAGTKKKE